jgi:hypothetical protein
MVHPEGKTDRFRRFTVPHDKGLTPQDQGLLGGNIEFYCKD